MVTAGRKYAGVFNDSFRSGPVTERDWLTAMRQQCVKFCPPAVPGMKLVVPAVRLASCGISSLMLE